jgi:translation elongation factor EF-4
MRLKQEYDNQVNNASLDPISSSSSMISEDQDLGRIMDSGDLEKERGITITSKVTRLNYFSNRLDQHFIINVTGKCIYSHISYHHRRINLLSQFF